MDARKLSLGWDCAAATALHVTLVSTSHHSTPHHITARAPKLTFSWPMAAFSSWIDEIHSPPDFTTSLLLHKGVLVIACMWWGKCWAAGKRAG